MNIISLETYAQTIFTRILDSTTRAGSGHPTSCTSALHILTYLFFSGIYTTKWNEWSDIRYDQFILSKGHASALLFSIYRTLDIISEEEFVQYRTFGGILEGHPTPRSGYTHLTTGSLGMGVGLANGIAYAQRRENSSARTFVLCGDSELAEGSIWESVQFATHHKLSQVVLCVDVNRLGQRGETMDGWDIHRIGKKFHAFGCHVILCEDGHDFESISQSFQYISSTKPTAIIFKTIKGWGIKSIENQNGWHGKIIDSHT